MSRFFSQIRKRALECNMWDTFIPCQGIPYTLYRLEEFPPILTLYSALDLAFDINRVECN